TTTRVSVGPNAVEGNGPSQEPSIALGNPDLVAFSSEATNFVTGDANNSPDVFVHDRGAGTTTLVSLINAGTAPAHGRSTTPAISATGQYVAFASNAMDLDTAGDTDSFFDVFVRNRTGSTTTRQSVGPGGALCAGDS